MNALVFMLAAVGALEVGAFVEQAQLLKAARANLLTPAYCTALHSIGNFKQQINNGGKIGPWYFQTGSNDHLDCYLAPDNSEGGGYPKGSDITYLFEAGLWIGAALGNDTLVSVGSDGWHIELYDFYPTPAPGGRILHRSTLDTEGESFAGAISEQDYIAVYSDTFTTGVPGLFPDVISGRSHVPLGIEVTQRSYAWSPGYVDDFFLLDLTVQNIGIASLRQLFIGLYVDGDVWYSPGSFGMPQDDLCGFLPTFSSSKECGFVDTVGLAWIADNDGDPYEGQWVSRGGVRPCRGIMGFRFLRIPADSKLSFNWWAGNMDPKYDFGPRARPSEGHPYRDFRTGGTGTPEGDGNKYHMLSNGEFDYDQAFVAKISMVDQHWLYPNPQVANLIKTGGDVRYLLSLGPFELLPGETVPLAFAYVLGENFHNDPDIRQYLESNQPEEWYKRVDFSNLVTNAKWAQWVYDNPGVDTDSDGYFGEYRVCVLDSQFIDGFWVPLSADTTWYKGDGVPDWRAVQPPPAPTFWLEPTLNGIRVRFNGQRSETTKDIFSGIIDFEGYRIYLGRDEREASLALAASYDKENYDIFVWNPLLQGTGEYEIQHIPASIDELRCRFGQGEDPCDDSLFDPLAYTRSNPWRSRFFVDSLFYFVPHENNSSRFGITTPIRKVYPEAVPPGPTDTVTEEDLTPDGYLKCYEYECYIENLLPTVSYYINVTAFDFGSPEADLEALETSKLLGVQSAYPYADRDQSDSTLPPVYIYPNPYRYDAHYRDAGYEGRASNRIDDRERRIHFVNVPARCVIRIHTLDGDLVRELRHDDDPSDPNAYRATWDLINRNAQPIVSGLYYWSVESTDGSVQMGKLVVIQ